MREFRKLALGASVLVLALSACSTGGGSATVKIGSDGFDEARVVAEIYAQALEAAGFTVDRAGIGAGTRAVTKAALEANEINIKPEYIGSGLVAYGGEATNNGDTNRQRLQEKLTPLGITVLNFTPGQDTNAFVVRKETADQYGTRLSDYAAVQNELKWAFATGCPTNPLCAAALKSAYGLEPTDVTLLDACSTPMADALKNETVDVAELCSTGPEIIVNGWVRLDDDKQTQPADHIAPIVRNDLLAAVDRAKFEKTLNDVSAKIDTATLAQLYYDVSVGRKDLADVASTWLRLVGLVTG
ncbi:MAG TPA: glycine betaine ABC transporter substrate-binding protein [Candidatus Limnocylindria bacterium]|nr:glycine betaine ABC transporter substrate-binding protein [Candidatus Limnocylindria bacterium]